MNREIKTMAKGFKTKDGAGVHLVRVLSRNTVKDFAPILMLDSFDTSEKALYEKGFPIHPHRGIETISYISQGKMRHRDSLGHQAEISSGEVQWMTAGSGIMHEEMIPESPRLLGVQLWLDLPSEYKMVEPEYKSINLDEIKEIRLDNGMLRVLAGEYKGTKGHISEYHPLKYYDLHLNKNSEFSIETESDDFVMIFTLLGDIRVEGKIIEEKTAVRLGDGKYLKLEALDYDVQVLIIITKPLEQPIAWGGPIVMNTKEELELAFDELSRGTFIKDRTKYER
ncbi:MAG: pirin family protein [Filifactoraceae bacterium]